MRSASAARSSTPSTTSKLADAVTVTSAPVPVIVRVTVLPVEPGSGTTMTSAMSASSARVGSRTVTVAFVASAVIVMGRSEALARRVSD